MKILLIQTGSIGRIVQTSPIIRSIRNKMHTKPDIVIDPKYKLVLDQHPNVGEVIGSNEIHSSTSLYDIIIDLVYDKFSRKLAKELGNEVYSFRSKTRKEWLFINFKINRLPNKHRIEQHYDFLSTLDLELDEKGLEYFIPEKDLVEDNWLPETHQHGYAVFALSSPNKTQQLPVQRMIELCDRINKPIVLLGEKKDDSLAEEVENFFRKGTEQQEQEIEDLNKKASIFNGCGKFNINQQASIIEKSNWVFTHENDLMHIAAAFKKQIFSIWGSSSPLFGEYPFETKFTIFENNKISCRPCSKTGYTKCPKGHFKCMKEVSFDFYLPD